MYIPKGNCIPQQTVLNDVRLARAYVPFQKYCGIMSPLESLMRGTAFAELFSPYRKREYHNIEPQRPKKPCIDGRRARYEP